jgi:hypothetical protein
MPSEPNKSEESEQSKLDKKPGLADRLKSGVKSVLGRVGSREPEISTDNQEPVRATDNAQFQKDVAKFDAAVQERLKSRTFRERGVEIKENQALNAILVPNYPAPNPPDSLVKTEQQMNQSVGEATGLTKKDSSKNLGANNSQGVKSGIRRG